MDNTTYPGSDTDITETYENRNFHSMAEDELDFVDHWVNSTVEKEILRGSKLREEKLRSYPQQEEYEVANINLVRSPCVEIKTSYYRKSLPRRTRMKAGCYTPRLNQTFIRASSPSSGYTSQMTYTRPNSPKYGPRCPMRIAELAVPTKRQCIETWRNKYDVLPAFMVDRLKQQIMDERPIVQIKEAISCFKRGTPKSINSLNRSKKLTRGCDSKLKNERMDEIRSLCAVFANKIAQRLIIPQNLKLTNEWEKISKIVAGDIKKIINRKKYDLDIVTSNKIQAEISDKITVWIARILEDTSHKILEEDLRVKKHLQRRDAKEERLVTLIQNLHQKSSSELEEEEGPVLDFIDDLIENVMTTCEPQEKNINENDDFSATLKSSSEKVDESIIAPDSIGNIEFFNSAYGKGDDTINKSNVIHLTSSTTLIQEIDNKSFDQNGAVESTEININDHIRGEIVKIVDSVIPVDQNDEIEINNHSSDIDIDSQIKDAQGTETDMAEEHQDLQKSPGNSELTAQLKDVQNDSALTEDVVLSSKNSLEDGKDDPDSNTKNVSADNDNVSDVFELLDEESLDDKDKKVKFSEVEMDVGGTIKESDSKSGVQSTEQNSNEKERVSWHSSTDIHEMVFAPPNEHLLSDADESWPDDITIPVLKPSASVSRSITSLGRILEKDEKSILQDEIDWEAHQTELEILNRTDVNNSQTEQQLEIIKKPSEQQALIKESINEKNSEDNTDESAALAIKTFEEKAMTYDKTVEANVPFEPETEHLIVDSSTSPLKLSLIDDIFVNNQVTIRDKQLTDKDSNINNIESDTNVIYEAVQQKMKSSYAMAEPKHDYKVHAKTAPSWLRHDHGKGEPSENSFRRGQSKEKYNETEIRSWCKDLDRIFINLEMWNNWINNTCKNIMHLKKRRESNNLFAQTAQRKYARDWIILKKNIDKNTVLWTKLNQKACERLKMYRDRTKYQQAEQSDILNISLQEIDSMCLWMHRMIVSTEYCMLCDCKNNIKRRI